jgi:hypothetical protein
VRVRVAFQVLPAALITRYFPADFREWYRRSETEALDNEEEKIRRLEQIEQIFSSSEFPVLVIEDFESTGLNGPVNSVIPEKNSESSLYHLTNALTCFFRRNGYSGKTDKNLGCAGLGRHVYYKASKISSKLIYTVPIDLLQEDDGKLISLEVRPFFFGQSFQRELAERDGNRQRRYCSYLNLSGRDIEGPDGSLPMPYGLNGDEADIVDQARIDFRLTRTPDQPGCSIIIPFPKENFTKHNLVNSIVRDFSMPILAGKLEVEVGGVVINAGNIAELSDEEVVNEHNAFLSEAIQSQPHATAAVAPDRMMRQFSEDLLGGTDLKQLARCYNDNGLVCVQADIQFGTRYDQAGSILICVRKTERGRKGRHIVARSGLVLSDYSDRNFTRTSNAVVIVQADHLGSLLRSIENPAHTEWLAGDVDSHKCTHPTELIQFIKSTHKALEGILANLDTEDDLNIFSDLAPAGRRIQPGKSGKPPFDIQIEDDNQTFSLSTPDEYDVEPGTGWRLSLIHDSVYGSGRARKGYRPGSFDLHDIPMQIEGGVVTGRGACHFDITISVPDAFRMTFGPCGFAGWADVRFHAEIRSILEEGE